MPGRNRTKTNCGVCLQKIIDGKEEAIFCEGKCQLRYHRGCASVPRELFATLTSSNVSFHCLTCSNSSLQQEVAELTMEIRRMQEALSVIPKLRDENAALSRQIAELRENQNSLKQARPTATKESDVIDSRAPSYTTQVAGTRPRRRRNNKQTKRDQGKIQNHSAQHTTQQQQQQQTETRPAPQAHCSQSKQRIVSVKGARKVWNTYKIVTASAISHAIHTITGIPTTSLSIKGKFRRSATTNKLTVWWFVIRGDESVLGQLDSLWPQVNLQTKWELKPLFSYAATVENSESGDPPSATIDSPRPADGATTSQEGPNPGDELLATTPSSSSSSSPFYQPQTPNPVT